MTTLQHNPAGQCQSACKSRRSCIDGLIIGSFGFVLPVSCWIASGSARPGFGDTFWGWLTMAFAVASFALYLSIRYGISGIDAGMTPSAPFHVETETHARALTVPTAYHRASLN